MEHLGDNEESVDFIEERPQLPATAPQAARGPPSQARLQLMPENTRLSRTYLVDNTPAIADDGRSLIDVAASHQSSHILAQVITDAEP